MVNSGNRKVFFRLFQLGAVGLLAIIGLVDLHLGMRRTGGLAPLEVLSAVAAAAVWLRGWPAGGVRLPKVALLVAGFSVLLTIAVVASGPSGRDFGVAEAMALLGVLFVLARRAEADWAVPSIGATVIAVGMLPLRGGASAEYVIAGLVLALAATVSIGGGVYLRTLSSNPQPATGRAQGG